MNIGDHGSGDGIIYIISVENLLQCNGSREGGQEGATLKSWKESIDSKHT
jgi:hypothetical protein